MTDLVNKVSGADKVDRKNSRGPLFKREKKARHPEEADGDSVDISQDARERAAGGKRRTILEFLEGDGD